MRALGSLLDPLDGPLRFIFVRIATYRRIDKFISYFYERLAIAHNSIVDSR